MPWIPFGLIITAAGLFFLMLAAILASFIEIRSVFYRTEDTEQKLEVRMYALWGLLRFRKETLFRLLGDVTPLHTTGDRIQDESGKIETPLEMMEKSRLLLANTKNFKRWMRKTMSHARLTEWQWETKVGAGDVVWTAMAAGAAWTLKTSFLGVLSQLTRLIARPKLSVAPVYNSTPHFSTRMSCTAKIRFGYAIVAGLYLLISAMKVKGGLGTWRNILFKG